MEGDLSAAVSCQATEDHQSTFILTLFEVSPPMLSEYVSGEDPAGTVTAELLSPLVFVDEHADVMNEAAVEMEAEHGQVSHMKDGGPIEADSEEQGDGADHRSVRTEFSTDVTSHRMSSSVDSRPHSSASRGFMSTTGWGRVYTSTVCSSTSDEENACQDGGR
ncbi:hypothetical protein JZ751_012395 [Albula glossodonta]|uniref:Uncharacterized protein n=1 Tax=Albula glossodonta TaxID=121402 RepID=A0A8T2PSJ9_9TELE|nr:hypothetical protein JZ751_012395 [Albula glossodonta]